MSKFKAYSLPTDADRAARADDVDRRRYMWFQGYINPIPTLYNATLKDGERGLGEEVIEEERQVDLAAILLSGEQLDALMDIAVAEGPDGSADQAVQAHPLFAESEGDTRGLLSSDGYDKQTGVPTPDVPSLTGYGVPRALFNRSNDGVVEDLMKKNPPLRTPADYTQIYQAFLKDSQSRLLKASKVIGFSNLDQIYSDDPILVRRRTGRARCSSTRARWPGRSSASRGPSSRLRWRSGWRARTPGSSSSSTPTCARRSRSPTQWSRRSPGQARRSTGRWRRSACTSVITGCSTASRSRRGAS